MKLIASDWVREKLLSKHGVTLAEIGECFANRDGGLLEDVRERHRTNPPTQWFIAETDHLRWLKVVFVQRRGPSNTFIEIRTAYEPNQEEVRIYRKFASR
jgi:uncharacterized DUF497 family protein